MPGIKPTMPSPLMPRPVGRLRATAVHKYHLSISNGHYILVDKMTATLKRHPATAFLDQLKAVPFIKRASFISPRKRGERFDGTLTLRTEQETFSLPVEFKLSYLDHASTHAISAVGTASRRAGRPLVVFARYIPRPTGEQLVAADVNFVDLAGNMH